MNIVSAYALFNASTGTYLGDDPQLVQINCKNLAAYSPRQVWLKRRLMQGNGTIIQYLPTFDASDPEIDANTIQGWMVQVGEEIIMLDAASAAAITDKCNACCDDVPQTVTRYYTSGVPDFDPDTLATYTITRTDDGSPFAVQEAAYAYLGQYVTMVHTSHSSGTSVYTVTAFRIPTAIGSDVVA